MAAQLRSSWDEPTCAFNSAPKQCTVQYPDRTAEHRNHKPAQYRRFLEADIGAIIAPTRTKHTGTIIGPVRRTEANQYQYPRAKHLPDRWGKA
jgi:hypothetical protein